MYTNSSDRIFLCTFFIYPLLSHIITIANLGDSCLLLKIGTYLGDRQNR